jgi:hypothetical protein
VTKDDYDPKLDAQQQPRYGLLHVCAGGNCRHTLRKENPSGRFETRWGVTPVTSEKKYPIPFDKKSIGIAFLT